MTTRITYASGAVHDFAGPPRWGPLQYRRAAICQRDGDALVSVAQVARELPPGGGDFPAWWVTLRIPGRPLTTVRCSGGLFEARQHAISGAEAAAQIVRMVPDHE